MKLKENTPTIKTNGLVLRKFTSTDVVDFFQLMSDKAVNTYLPWFPLKSEEEAKSVLKNRFLHYYEKESAYRYAICLQADNKAIGYVCLSDSKSNDFGYGLKKEFWHKGIVTTASKAVVAKIADAGYEYITATHDTNNLYSGKVMEKLGMSYRYSYVEQWQPKNISVTFRMYQLNFDGDENRTYMGYWNTYENHFKEII